MPASSFFSVVTGDTSNHFIMDPTGTRLIDISGIYNDVDDDTNTFDTPGGNFLLFNYQLHGTVVDRNFNVIKHLYSPRDVRDTSGFDRFADVPTKFYTTNQDTFIGFNLVDFDDPNQNLRNGVSLSSPDRSPVSTGSNVLFTKIGGKEYLAMMETYNGSTYEMYLYAASSGTRVYRSITPDSTAGGTLVDTPSYIIRIQEGNTSSNGISVFNKTTFEWSTKVTIDAVNSVDDVMSGRTGWELQFYATDTELYFIYRSGANEFVHVKVENIGTTPSITATNMGPMDFTWTAKFYRFQDAFAPWPEVNKVLIRVDEYTDGSYNDRVTTHVLIYDLTLTQEEAIIFTNESIDALDRVFRTKYQITGTVSGLSTGQTSTVCLLNRQGHVLHRVVTDNTGAYTLPCFSPDPQIVLVMKPNNVVAIHDNVVPIEV